MLSRALTWGTALVHNTTASMPSRAASSKPGVVRSAMAMLLSRTSILDFFLSLFALCQEREHRKNNSVDEEINCVGFTSRKKKRWTSPRCYGSVRTKRWRRFQEKSKAAKYWKTRIKVSDGSDVCARYDHGFQDTRAHPNILGC